MYYDKEKRKDGKHYAGMISLNTDRKIRYIQIPTKKYLFFIDLDKCKITKKKR